MPWSKSPCWQPPAEESGHGGDPQLERGIEEVLRLLKERSYVAPKRPPYVDRSGRGPGQ
jgi:hypothetical protein